MNVETPSTKLRFKLEFTKAQHTKFLEWTHSSSYIEEFYSLQPRKDKSITYKTSHREHREQRPKLNKVENDNLHLTNKKLTANKSYLQ